MENRKPYADLLDMIRMRRPAWSKSEKQFIRDWIKPLGIERDALGNCIKRIGTAPVLWSSHTDTVHATGGKQSLAFQNGLLTIAPNSMSNCLGADCTAGAWLMREMALAGVEGLYIWHRAEEIGGLGSNYIAKHTPALVHGIKYAVAFDRRDTGDVITHQGFGERTASDGFAEALALQLGGSYRPDDSGVFTDTANYTDLIPECSNISVGFIKEHTASESLDIRHLLGLRETMLNIDVSKLPSARVPGSREYGHDTYRSRYGYLSDHNSLSNSRPGHDRGGWDIWETVSQEPRGGIVRHVPSNTRYNLEELIQRYPEAVADYLESQGVDQYEIEQYLADSGVI